MSDENNPEEKPSFFDSGEESKSWPPSDNYEIDDQPANPVSDSSSQSFFDNDNFDNPFKEEDHSQESLEANSPSEEYIIEDNNNTAPEEYIIEAEDNTTDLSSTNDTEEDFLDSDDFLDQLIDNVDEKNNINNMRIIDDEIDESQNQAQAEISSEPQEPISQEELVSNLEETDASYEEDLENDLNIESVVNENEFQEAVTDDSDDFDLDDLIEDDFSSNSSVEETIPGLDKPPAGEIQEPTNQDFETTHDEDPFADSVLAAGAGIAASNMAFSDPEGITNAQNEFEPSFQDNFDQGSNDFETQDYQAQASFDDGYAESEFVDFVDEDEDSNLKPFRTFTKINLAEELADEKDEEEEAGGILAGVNRNVLIIIAIILLSLGYFLFSTIFSRKIETKSRQRTRPPRKEKLSTRAEQVLTPVWEVASQKVKNPDLEDKYAKSLIKFTGRDNPFAMPQSVIDALKRQADMALLAKKKPNTFKRMAYRATLLGVLTSEGSTIALVNMQEATFDVIEGTTKNKVLKLATKSMDKAKKNTLEMAKGSFIGPWEITKVATPSGAFSDAKITVEFQGTQKVLSMGKAEDLGIFDPAGQLDDLESTENEFEDDDFDDDF